MESDSNQINNFIVHHNKKIEKKSKNKDIFKSLKVNENSTSIYFSYNEICNICFEISSFEHAITPCGHKFCTECLRRWLEREKFCPTCKKSFI